MHGATKTQRYKGKKRKKVGGHDPLFSIRVQCPNPSRVLPEAKMTGEHLSFAQTLMVLVYWNYSGRKKVDFLDRLDGPFTTLP